MYKISLNVKNQNSNDESLLIMYITFNNQRIKISTKEKIHPSLWDSKNKKVIFSKRKTKRFIEQDVGLLTRLNGIQLRIDSLINEIDKYFTKMVLHDSVPDLSDLKDHIYRYLNPKKETILLSNYVTDFLKVFIEEMASGYRKKTNGITYKRASIVCYENLLSTIKRFEKKLGLRIKWNDINKKMYYSFISWHEANKYSINYIGRHIKDLKSIMRIAHEEKIHNNITYMHKFFAVPKEMKKKIPLTHGELIKLNELDLSHDKHMDRSRNIFVLGCCLGLRVSDLKRITFDNVNEDANGKYIHIKTLKTGIEVKIPLNKMATLILSKCNYQLPKFAEQVVNRHLKVLGKEIGLKKERYSKLSIHYSRATFAKLAYEMGIPSMYIMRVTGHTSEQNFLRYINIDQQEAVVEFRKYDFFK